MFIREEENDVAPQGNGQSYRPMSSPIDTSASQPKRKFDTHSSDIVPNVKRPRYNASSDENVSDSSAVDSSEESGAVVNTSEMNELASTINSNGTGEYLHVNFQKKLTEFSENHEFLARTVIDRAKNLKIWFLQDERTAAWLSRIMENTRKMFPRARLFLYGSRFYQLGDDHSDVNIYVDMGKTISKQENKLNYDCESTRMNIY